MTEWTKEQLEEMFGNDIVEQLAFLAGCTKHSYSDPKNPELSGFIISSESLHKFAELIVRECSAFANHFSDGHEKDQFGRKMFHYTADIGQVILEHFGVEE